MGKIFVRPSQIVERLRATLLLIQAKVPTFPDLEVKAVSDTQIQEELADSDAATPEAITLYVGSGLSTGSLTTDAGMGITNVTHGINIGLVIGTRDEHAQYADELQTLIKEFVIVSLHGWEWEEGYTPLFFANESLFKVKGSAIFFRTYDFFHQVDVEYQDVDNNFDLFDNLDEFLLLKGDMEADNQDGDTAIVPHEVDLLGT